MQNWLDLIRGSVRPAITIAFTILIAIMFYRGMVIPELLQWTWIAIIAEWFSERAISKAFSAIKLSAGNGNLATVTKEKVLQTVENAVFKVVKGEEAK